MTRVSKTLGATAALLFVGTPAFGQALSNQDDCANASVDTRTGDGAWDFDNSGATTGPDGQAEGACYSFGTDDIQSDIWFVWEASVDGSVVIDTCASIGTNTDTKIAAYPGTSCPADGSSVACNDDTCGLLSEISFAVACGESYVIQLGSFPGSTDGTATVTAIQAGTACSPPITETEWTQSVDNTTLQAGSVACLSSPAGITDNSYYRLYDPASCGVVGDFEVVDVTFGIESTSGPSDCQTVFLNVRDGTGFPVVANMPILGSTSFQVPTGIDITDQYIRTIPITTGIIPAGTPIALELMSLNGQSAPGDFLFPGANALGETADSYIAAADCGIPDPLPMGAIGFPDVHLVLDLTAREGGPIDDTLGTNYCTANTHSGGIPGVMSANGSAIVADNRLTLTASDLPPNEFGYFIAGPGNGTVAPANSSGIFCLAGGDPNHLGRYDGLCELFDSGVSGTGSLAIDLNNVPIAGGVDPNGPFTRALLPGETWNFQCWFRDSATNNFTDAVSILFEQAPR
ncbi:MAG: hypothetical protein GY711_25100 [bacterium]|nr:hypothetical protein [bacterium]